MEIIKESSMYGGIGIPIHADVNECMTVVNAIEVIVPFWDDLVQEKIKEKMVHIQSQAHSMPIIRMVLGS